MKPSRPSSSSAWRLAGGLLLPACLAAQPAPVEDGRILSEEPCAALPAHAELDAFGKWYFEAARWERIRGNASVACRHLRYSSGGVPVDGFLLTPPVTSPTTRLPAIIYNRGGTGNFGRIDALLLAEMRLLAEQGFVVAASDTRFVGELGRGDQWGGADLDDVLNLVPLLKAQRSVDARNLFMVGLSRGGLMTYLALKRKAPINAAAVIAGTADLTRMAVERPEFILGDEDFDGWAKVWPDFTKRSREHLEARSAVFWADEIRAPLLILHSRTDKKVPVEEALDLAQQLQKHGREYELVICGSDGHSLPLHRDDRNRRIMEWFRARLVP